MEFVVLRDKNKSIINAGILNPIIKKIIPDLEGVTVANHTEPVLCILRFNRELTDEEQIVVRSLVKNS